MLADSMAEAMEVDGRVGLLHQIRKDLRNWPTANFSDDDLKVEPYGGDDPRIGWKNVHIVTVRGYGVMGFCEGSAD